MKEIELKSGVLVVNSISRHYNKHFINLQKQESQQFFCGNKPIELHPEQFESRTWFCWIACYIVLQSTNGIGKTSRIDSTNEPTSELGNVWSSPRVRYCVMTKRFRKEDWGIDLSISIALFNPSWGFCVELTEKKIYQSSGTVEEQIMNEGILAQRRPW